MKNATNRSIQSYFTSPRPSIRIALSLLGPVLVMLIGSVVPAYAGTINVDCSISQLISAINNANATLADDTISLTANCPYTLTAVDNNGTFSDTNGLPVIVDTTAGGKLIIEGNGATIKRSSA